MNTVSISSWRSSPSSALYCMTRIGLGPHSRVDETQCCTYVPVRLQEYIEKELRSAGSLNTQLNAQLQEL